MVYFNIDRQVSSYGYKITWARHRALLLQGLDVRSNYAANIVKIVTEWVKIVMIRFYLWSWEKYLAIRYLVL